MSKQHTIGCAVNAPDGDYNNITCTCGANPLPEPGSWEEELRKEFANLDFTEADFTDLEWFISKLIKSVEAQAKEKLIQKIKERAGESGYWDDDNDIESICLYDLSAILDEESKWDYA